MGSSPSSTLVDEKPALTHSQSTTSSPPLPYCPRKVLRPHIEEVWGLCLTKSNSILSCGADGYVRETDLVTGKEIRRRDTLHVGYVSKVLLSPNGTFVVSCGGGKEVKILLSPKMSLIQTLSGHTKEAHCIGKKCNYARKRVQPTSSIFINPLSSLPP